jgi:mannose-6-phosphate isomerase class I
MVIALKEFGGFAGFETWEQIKENFERYETLKKYFAEQISLIEIKAKNQNSFSQRNTRAFKIKSLLEYIIDITDTKTPIVKSKNNLNIKLDFRQTQKYKLILPKLVKNLKEEISKFETLTIRDQVTVQLIDQYGADVGILITLLLQYVELNPLESMLLVPNVPHCYFKGEIIEIMHSSNNVIRLGLTKKFKDKKNLLNLVDYKHDPLPILNESKKRNQMMNSDSTDLNDFIINYSTNFDHLFRVNIFYRDRQSDLSNEDKKDFLFFVKNCFSFKDLKGESGECAESIVGPFDKDSVILNLGAPVEIKRNNKNEKYQEVGHIYYEI